MPDNNGNYLTEGLKILGSGTWEVIKVAKKVKFKRKRKERDKDEVKEQEADW